METSIPLLKVEELFDLVNQSLDYAYPFVLVEGEIDSFKISQNKFVFFNIKNKNVSLSCFMMLFNLRVPIEDGMLVVLKAKPKVTKWSKFSLTVESIQPKGKGDIKKSFDKLKDKLSKEGLFDESRKRSLPKMPRSVGVVSSVESAGYADFMKITNSRWGGVNFNVYHTAVQGVDAPDQIIKGLKYFNEMQNTPDVIVLIRGGGSSDDLAAFNDELLVKQVASSRSPVLVGVGHEVDVTLCDLVADKRAATPSNAAEMLTPDKQEIYRQIDVAKKNLYDSIVQIIKNRSHQVEFCMDNGVKMIDNRLSIYHEKVKNLQKIINSYDPEKVLKKGYAILSGQVDIGNTIYIETFEYNISAEVLKSESR